MKTRAAAVLALSGVAMLGVVGVREHASENAARASGHQEAAAEVQRRRGPDEYVGVLTARRTAVVEVEFEARVQQLLVRMGDRVAQGDPVARLDEGHLRQKLGEARAAAGGVRDRSRAAALDLADARHRFDLERRLFRDGVARRETVRSAGAALASAKRASDESAAALRMAEAAVAEIHRQLGATTLTAPIAGVVSVVGVRGGDRLAPGTAILRIFDPSELRVRFAVPPEDAARVRAGTGVLLTVAGSDLVVPGTVRQVAHQLAPLRLLMVEADIEEAELARATGSAAALGKLPVQAGAVGRVRLAPARADQT
ncbi:MAG TPA: HlyD family efflux transporter periplasmic adaptor subunit [Kofleriaceae bacterium]|nr:HlyD family efflux transporter periplasmic adaptor subunit [Kofleriaceae bacterium]